MKPNIIVATKKCSSCGKTKPISGFPIRRDNKYNFPNVRNICKECKSYGRKIIA